MKLSILLLFAEISCLAQPSAVDLSFNPGSGSGSAATIEATALTTNGQIIIGGEFTSFNGFPNEWIARLNSDGSFDQSFYPGYSLPLPVSAVATQFDGGVLALSGENLMRLRSDGSLDVNFTNTSSFLVHAFLNCSSTQFLAGGTGIARFNTNGTLDPDFNAGNPLASGGGAGEILAFALQTNGYVLVGGSFVGIGESVCQSIARLDGYGNVDATFVGPVPNEQPFGTVNSIVLQTNGEIIIGGEFSSIYGYTLEGIARLKSDGTLDTTFRPPLSGGTVRALAIQSNGKILVAGSSILERLNTDGSLDTSFSPSVNSVDAISVQPDGRILLAGGFDILDTTPLSCIGRLIGDSAAQAGVQFLNMNLYPGAFLSGNIGANYRVEYTTNLNSKSLWTPLTIFTMTNSPAFIADPNSPQGSKFYRAVALP